MSDNINHPPHYLGHVSGVECIDVAQGLSFTLGNALKYVWRHGAKGQGEEDLKKAIWYIQREIAIRGSVGADLTYVQALDALNAKSPAWDLVSNVAMALDADALEEAIEHIQGALRFLGTDDHSESRTTQKSDASPPVKNS